VEMKNAFDEKVTPYEYEVGGNVLLNNLVEKLEFPGNYKGMGQTIYHILVK